MSKSESDLKWLLFCRLNFCKQHWQKKSEIIQDKIFHLCFLPSLQKWSAKTSYALTLNSQAPTIVYLETTCGELLFLFICCQRHFFMSLLAFCVIFFTENAGITLYLLRLCSFCALREIQAASLRCFVKLCPQLLDHCYNTLKPLHTAVSSCNLLYLP